MILLFCGLSGAGKTTLATSVQEQLKTNGIPTEIIDGDEYRNTICKDLGFSKEDRCENIRRLGFIASKFSAHHIVTIISAINPYETIRSELQQRYKNVKVVYVQCTLEKLMNRDTKGLYRRALLPAGNPEKICNLTGINDEFEVPAAPDILIDTATESIEKSTARLAEFTLSHFSSSVRPLYPTFILKPAKAI